MSTSLKKAHQATLKEKSPFSPLASSPQADADDQAKRDYEGLQVQLNSEMDRIKKENKDKKKEFDRKLLDK